MYLTGLSVEYSSGEYRFHTTEYAQTKSCIKRDNILLLNSMYDSRCASCLGLFTECSKIEWSNERVSRSSHSDTVGNAYLCEGDGIMLKKVLMIYKNLPVVFNQHN